MDSGITKDLIKKIVYVASELHKEKIPTKNGPFLWIGLNCLKAIEPLSQGSLLLTTKIPEDPGTHLIDLGRIIG